MNQGAGLSGRDIESAVTAALAAHPIFDFHTHLYAPSFSGLMLYGVDELLTYHYVIAELLRASSIAPQELFARSKAEQADLVWKELFVLRSPVSEACRGVVTTLQAFGLDVGPRELPKIRRWFAEQDADRHVDRVMQLSNVRAITMTNDVFDDVERTSWLSRPDVGEDPRFRGVVRIDPLVVAYPDAARRLSAWGYELGEATNTRTIEDARRFLREWIARTSAVYVAVSLPPEFRYPAGDAAQAMIEQVIVPVCAEHGIGFAMMIGARRAVNSALGQAGDGLGRADVDSVVNICRAFPKQRFFVTMLSRENQHELCVAARKFSNLTIFGCWWFLNVPSLIEEITRMRLELLGTTFLPQHSDARVLDQLVYKWCHGRHVIGKVLTERYTDLAASGWPVSRADIARDVKALFDGSIASVALR
jgi:hypothetical protein